ncbi:hypothetical protein A2130_04105 [Candidatus Woesebacteria bacterium GWC2_33_12]|uniref:Oxidoreductase, 2Fe-2S and FAD/NAD(P) binding domain protein n=1 Tax=Candidatus Woesebacteria bacterium GW2011_GWB1_33_22 TaxID=1618566 RepID=A0A0F9ZMU7_9BACT|nr:MAG: Oxidoreductase, 2Fe-2S and FAD/NAD(P) binding domain protein [Candidatus Woesebacteria bacterium GW2011_GWC2_33_12]KKP42647.1 MAG: Oxidoreductase, 2Fe-2S and FAD/NAD(P) binding domain protein [Candidatus Woesebacteria bacterium GW2011_GWA2_33_20]KKP45578.1 MAG: Oxidoreductase, 2Fe-2S and FAD/NAD(P) binding domain protein [Candidatus Woesebacteria bacterium GW2011_GWB1_33_22]KKP47450.1 MAG: Oxidoreductase, 2Fe-2S and FAD/NAD(P) binding domain protein [Microgenomates group bacterium GW2011
MKLTLVKKITEAKSTKSFYFEPDISFTWLPGQYIYITLSKLNYPDERGMTRHFTISSSPTEGDLIQITTRIREESGYKKTLDELQIGSIVKGKGPQETFVLDSNRLDSRFSVFLAGGIGITPFRSMIKYNIDKKLNLPMYLIYSNSDSEFVFKKELDLWQKENDFIKVEYINTSATGRIDTLKIEKLIANWKLIIDNYTFSVVGPNIFVDAMEDALEQLNIPSAKIHTEKFTGY